MSLRLWEDPIFISLEIIKKVLLVVNIIVTWQWGISAIIWGMIAFSIICYYLNSYYTGALISYPTGEQLRDLYAYLIMAVLMGIGTAAVGSLAFPNEWSALLTQMMIGLILYVTLCRLFRLTVFMELWKAGWEKFSLRNKGHQINHNELANVNGKQPEISAT